MSIFYVTKDVERATGIDLDRYNEFYILTNRSPLADALYFKYPKRVLLNDEKPFNTLELMQYYASSIEEIDPQPRILVFKNSRQIERFCDKQNWQLLNPKAALTEKFEHKISQADWFKSLQLDAELPDAVTAPLETLKFDDLALRFGNPFMLQFNLGHTGEGTRVITSPYDLEQEKQKTPKREVKIMRQLKGQTYTINACVCPNKIHVGHIALQLTGLPELTDNPWATVGNDWLAAKSLYSQQSQAAGQPNEYIPSAGQSQVSKNLGSRIEHLAKQLGRAMRLERWLGLFGIDVLIEEQSRQLYLLEVNARQQAGATFETQVAHTQGAAGPLDWHVHCLSNIPQAYPIRKYDINSSQVFLRISSGLVYDKFGSLTQIGEYNSDNQLIVEKPIFDLTQENKNRFIIPQATGSELIRIQTNKSADFIE